MNASALPARPGRVASIHLSPLAISVLVRLAQHARPNGFVAVTKSERADFDFLEGLDELLSRGLLGIPKDVVHAEGELVFDLSPAATGGGTT